MPQLIHDATVQAPDLVPASSPPLDVEAVRAEFPILRQTVRGKPLVYLDNAATTQKPVCVLDAVDRYYREANSNVHRGVHFLSEKATAAYEGAREAVARFIGAPRARQIIFTRGTTEAINLVAQSWGRSTLQPGDEIITTWLEHHSNIVPWQMVCAATGATLKVVPVLDNGELDLAAYTHLLTDRTRLVAVGHVSNALGTINPLAEIIERAHQQGALVLVDGAQAVAHQTVRVQELGCDFYAFSGHKMYAPTGIGVLYGRENLLEQMPPWQGGGDMISSVTFEKTSWNALPYKFEAGTPHVAGAVGLGAATAWLEQLGLEKIARHETTVLKYGTEILSALPDLRIIGTAPHKAGILSFMLGDIHPHDLGTILDAEGVAIRAGHHCAQPLMQRFGVAATARASLAPYNTCAEMDALKAALERAREVFS